MSGEKAMKKMLSISILWSGCLLARLAGNILIAPIIPLFALQQTIQTSFGLSVGILFTITQLFVMNLFSYSLDITTIGIMGVAVSASLITTLSIKHSFWQPFMTVILFDMVTGLCMGPLVWHQPLSVALAGQIPHTCLHLLTTGLWMGICHKSLHHLLQTSLKTEANEARVE